MTRILTLSLLLSLFVLPLDAQSVRIAEVTSLAGEVPRRVMGYGLVVGLPGTGDRAIGGVSSSGHTVRSVANLLERFGVRVPEEHLRTRNVAAVMVTGEISAYARPGARFDIQVSSIGDARSIEGGVLWMTPLVQGPESSPVASAQGQIFTARDDSRRIRLLSSAGSVHLGGVLEVSPPETETDEDLVLLLRQADARIAQQIRQAVEGVLGEGAATVEDPGSVRIQIPDGQSRMDVLAQVQGIEIEESHQALIVEDARSASVVAGGAIEIGPASVSHNEVTLIIGGAPADETLSENLARADAGSSVQDVVGALHAAGASGDEIGTILLALRQVGALRAEVEIR